MSFATILPAKVGVKGAPSLKPTLDMQLTLSSGWNPIDKHAAVEAIAAQIERIDLVVVFANGRGEQRIRHSNQGTRIANGRTEDPATGKRTLAVPDGGCVHFVSEYPAIPARLNGGTE